MGVRERGWEDLEKETKMLKVEGGREERMGEECRGKGEEERRQGQ